LLTLCHQYSRLYSNKNTAALKLFTVLLYCHAPFFFNDTATTEIYTLSLHDALPILRRLAGGRPAAAGISFGLAMLTRSLAALPLDRKSTRLNSSHVAISYAVFCLKKKKHYQSHLYCQLVRVFSALDYMRSQLTTHEA